MRRCHCRVSASWLRLSPGILATMPCLVLRSYDALPVMFSFCFQQKSTFGLDWLSTIAMCIRLLCLYRCCRWKNNSTESCFFFSFFFFKWAGSLHSLHGPLSCSLTCTSLGMLRQRGPGPRPVHHSPRRLSSLRLNFDFTYKHPSHIFHGIQASFGLQTGCKQMTFPSSTAANRLNQDDVLVIY